MIRGNIVFYCGFNMNQELEKLGLDSEIVYNENYFDGDLSQATIIFENIYDLNFYKMNTRIINGINNGQIGLQIIGEEKC